MTHEKAREAIGRIWSASSVREASDRCDKITSMCEIMAQADDDHTPEGQAKADEWLALKSRAITEFNTHVPIVAQG